MSGKGADLGGHVTDTEAVHESQNGVVKGGEDLRDVRAGTTKEASSRKVTSRRQWTRFSRCEWARTN